MIFMKKKSEEPDADAEEFLKKNIRRIEKGLRRNLGYTRKDALLFCRDLKDSLQKPEN